MTFGRRLGVAAVCLGVLVVGGCADDEPVPRTSPPSQTPTSASPSPTTPTREPWERKTGAGAVAFAKHWMETFSAAMNSGDTSSLERLNAQTCATCTGVVDRIDSIYAAGGSYRSQGWRVQQADAEVSSGVSATVAMSVHRTAEVFRGSANAAPERNPASQASYSAHLTWSNGSWTMARLDLAG